MWSQLEENYGAIALERHLELWKQRTGGVAVAVATMSRAIRDKLGWSYKKASLGASERD